MTHIKNGGDVIEGVSSDIPGNLGKESLWHLDQWFYTLGDAMAKKNLLYVISGK